MQSQHKNPQQSRTNQKRSFQEQQQQSSKSTSTPSSTTNTQKNNPASSTKDDMKEWWKARSVHPFEAKRGVGGVKLNFNYWKTQNFITSTELQRVLDHFLLQNATDSKEVTKPQLNSTQFQKESFLDAVEEDDGSEEVQQVVVLNIHGLDPDEVQCHYDEAAFFQSSTSVPLLCVQFPDHKKRNDTSNPNVWFYNDVKSISSLLLWSNTNPIPFATVANLPISELFHEHRLGFEVDFGDGTAQLIMQTDKYNYICEQFSLVLTTLLEAVPSSKQKTRDSIEEILESTKENNGIYGKYYRIHSTDGGMFALIPQPQTSRLRLVLMWDKDGDIEVLDSTSTFEWKSDGKIYSKGDTMAFRSSRDVFIVPNEIYREEDRITLTLDYVYERPGTVLLSENLKPNESMETEVEDADMTRQTAITTLDSTGKMASPKSNEVDVEEVLSRVRATYETLPPNTLEKFQLPNEILDIMGYMLEVENSGCIATSDTKKWSLQSFSDSLLLANPSHNIAVSTSTSTNNPFASLDLEDGEEIDEENDGELIESSSNVPLMSAKSFQRIFQQSTYFFAKNSKDGSDSFLPCNITLPLDVVAFDCEMCSTKLGLELTRISMLHPVHGVILDCLVKPNADILDYHTEFSGVDEQQLEKITVTLSDIQALLRCLIDANTILLGHSLDADLKALQLVHTRIIDTAALYPHPSGLPYKHQLKKLAKDLLQQEIQEGSEGHNSIQDSVAALELVILKANQYLSNHQQFEDEMMQIGLNHVNNVKLINGNSTVKYSYFEHLENNIHDKDTKLQVHIFSNPLISQRPTWERDALGCRDDSNVRTALKRFEVKITKPEYIVMNSSTCSNWKEVLSSMTQHSKVNQVNTRSLIWGDIDLLTDAKEMFQIPDEDNEDDQRSKRTKLEPNSVTETSGEGNDFALFNKLLNELYESLPRHTLMLIPTQSSLLPLRQMIAKKIRFKWDANSGTRKKPKVALLGREKNQRFKFEWDGNNDENKLIDESHHAAEGVLYMRLKR